MTFTLILKTALIWLLIALLAVGNGILREKLLVPALGKGRALPVSGITLALIVLLVTWLTFDFIGMYPAATYLYVGLQWVIMTLAFEFLFGHYAGGKSWQVLLQVFDVRKGDLFLLVLVVTLLAPLGTAILKGIV